MNSYRIDALYTLLSPLSHIGESVGVDSYLNTTSIIGEDGKPIECFVYTGNAFRGMWRDAGAKYMLDKLNGLQLPLPAFHLLFSGGSLGGEQDINIDQAREIRKTVPHISIFGGGIGNQILSGKMKIGAGYPLCREAQRLLPVHLRDDDAISWRAMTMEQSFTRMDDAKNENLRPHLIEASKEQELIEGETKKKKDGPAQQMRYTVEAMSPGTKLYQRIDVFNVNEIEFGAFVAAIHEWSRNPYIGGKSNVGYGLVDAEMEIVEPDGNTRDFIRVGQDTLKLSDEAEHAKQQYDDHLKYVYDAYLVENQGDITELLVAGAK